MGEHLLHSLIPAADRRVERVELARARESHSAFTTTHPVAAHFANWGNGRTPATNAVRHRNLGRQVLVSAANFEPVGISGADDVAVTFADERLS